MSDEATNIDGPWVQQECSSSMFLHSHHSQNIFVRNAHIPRTVVRVKKIVNDWTSFFTADHLISLTSLWCLYWLPDILEYDSAVCNKKRDILV